MEKSVFSDFPIHYQDVLHQIKDLFLTFDELGSKWANVGQHVLQIGPKCILMDRNWAKLDRMDRNLVQMGANRSGPVTGRCRILSDVH